VSACHWAWNGTIATIPGVARSIRFDKRDACELWSVEREIGEVTVSVVVDMVIEMGTDGESNCMRQYLEE
jgi:hypothetical protein